MSAKSQQLASFIWSVADLLRGDYKQSEYGRVILPFTVLRRLDCVLEPTKDKVLAEWERLKSKDMPRIDQVLNRAAGTGAFHNTSPLTFAKIVQAPDDVDRNLRSYLNGFSAGAAEMLGKYGFDEQITRLDDAKLLYQVTAKFADIDLHPGVVSNHDMGYVFEELVRKFSEISNETAGEHFTPREVIKLIVRLLLAPDEETLRVPGTIKRVYDPACGTGGMLTAAEDYITEFNPQARVAAYGQELNGETWAICRSDMMLKGQDPSKIAFGNSFSQDGHPGERFDYLLANPPFGVEWKKVEKAVRDERARGFAGRFGAGLPRINDGSLLFLQHMISKMKRPEDGGTRLAIVFNGSPLFTGAAESGESNIRRWILENDWLEAIVALPDQLFYNTGISTYFWILTNRKQPQHKGKVVLLDARGYWQKMRRSLGDKRKLVSDEQIAELTRLYGDASAVAADSSHSLHGKVKVFRNRDFGYRRITVERPLRLRFEVTEETLEELAATRAVAGYEGREQLLGSLKRLVGTTVSAKVEFRKLLAEALGALKLPANVDKAVWSAVSVPDSEGELQTKKGEPLPDPDLRDFENVPLDEDVPAYFDREVLPHVPDAWIDHSKTKIGVRDPVHSPLLRLPATPSPGGDRRRTQVPRSGDPALAHRGNQMTWPLTKLKRVATTVAGGTPSVNEPSFWADQDEGVAWVSISDMSDRNTVLTTDRRVTEAGVRAARLPVADPGTLLLSMYASLGHSAFLETRASWNQAILGVIPSPLYDKRFLKYSLEALKPQLGEFARSNTQANLNAELVGNLGIPCPPLAEQQRITDFLDTEVKKILREIALYSRLCGLTLEHRDSLVETFLGQPDAPWRFRPLSWLTHPSRPIMYGIILPGPNVSDGVPIIKGGDVGAGRLDPTLLSRTTREIEARYKRSRVQNGDLVIAIRGSVGEVATVPGSLVGANLTQDTARISPAEDVNSRWLELTLQAPSVTAEIHRRVTGATIKGINIWDLKRILVPTPSFPDQSNLVQQLEPRLQRHKAIIEHARHQQALLAERSLALITAAVTGQIDVTTAGRAAEWAATGR